MAGVRKYLKGPPVMDIMEAVREIMEGRYMIWREKPMHPSFMGSMAINLVSNQCRHGVLFFARINPEYRDPAVVGVEFEEIEG